MAFMESIPPRLPEIVPGHIFVVVVAEIFPC